ncbi:MAG TPA: M13 family metallopeptidase, partial [Thermoanaerobaculia bacterium]|nr:M13 family metallopeptidase [Thermoanaerobaculia bacterium]
TAAPPAKPLLGDAGYDLAAIDRSVGPCDDFYQFAVGKWREAHPLPPEFARFGRFEELAERNRQTLHTILEEAAADTSAAPGSATRKIGDFYAACMNETAIEQQGVQPIRADLDRIDAISDRASLLAEVQRMQQRGVSTLFGVSAQNDFKNSKQIVASIGSANVGLPDRDYYLRDDERFKTYRQQYVDHVTKMFTLAGEDQTRAAADAQRILSLETRLASATLPRTELRNPEARYHPMPVAEVATLAPSIQWSSYLSNLGVHEQTVNVTQPKYIQALNQALTEVPLDDWKAYLRYRVIDAAAPTLSRAFSEEDFDFNGRILSGQQKQQERWKRCVRAADQSVGQLLGQEYVRRTFTPEAKAKMSALIDNLIAALRADIPTLQWMGPETKAAAIAKLNAFQRRIGYPDKWIDYGQLDIGRGSYYANAIASRTFGFRRQVSRIGKPDDPNEWGFFTPPTVNAGYNPPRNDITFPAGILQPPFYDPNADDAYNYGGIGTVIGHEMTHGFDDQGAKFDAEGNLRNWWTDADLKNFQSRAECIANQYSEFNVAPNININGKLVTGEAIADLGGATIAYAAYQKSLEGKPRRTIDGFTPEQRFFLGFAQVWAENISKENATRLALTDPHAQGPFRVNATVANMPAFHKAFGCAETSKMVREAGKRCAIW